MAELRVEIQGRHFYVYEDKPRMVQETTVVSGKATVQLRSFAEVFKLLADPDVLNAYYSPESDCWHCDVDCGLQRYRCVKTTGQLRNGLKRLGLPPHKVKDLVKTIMAA